MPYVIDLSKEIPKDKFERVRNLVVQAVANDPRFAPQQRMSIISEIVDTLNQTKPKTYEDFISALDASVPRKKGYIPDAKRLVVEMLAKDAGVPLDAATTQVKFRGNTYSLFNEPGQRTLRSGFIDKQKASDKLMEPLQRVLHGDMSVEPLRQLSPDEARAAAAADEALAQRIREALQQRGVQFSQAPTAQAAQRVSSVAAPALPAQAQALTLPQSAEAALAERIIKSVPAAASTPQTVSSSVANAAETAAAVKPAPPTSSVKITPLTQAESRVTSNIEQVKSLVGNVLESLRKRRSGIPEQVEKIVKEVIRKAPK